MVATGVLDLPCIRPGDEGMVRLPDDILNLKHPQECWLTVTFRLREDTSWAKAGHTIAWYQSRLAKPAATIDSQHSATTKAALDSRTSPTLTLSATRLSYTISTPSTTMTFDRVCGQICSWTYRHPNNSSGSTPVEILTDSRVDTYNPASPSPLFPLDFWRPKTDNDIAWQTSEWKRHGLHLMTLRLKEFLAFVNSSPDSTPSLVKEDSTNVPGMAIILRAEHALAPPSLDWHFNVVTTYTITANSKYPSTDAGGLKVRIHTVLTPHGTYPPNLPRIGHNIQLSPEYKVVKWFGRGQQESYNDKYLSQPVGIYEKKIADMGEDYEVPQENGNRCDVRWVSVSSSPSLADRTSRKEKKHEHMMVPTLRASYAPGPHETDRPNMQFSTQMYDPATIDNAKHPCDLLEPGKMRQGALWRLDADVAGVGTAACGPGTEEKDQVLVREREWTLVLEVL